MNIETKDICKKFTRIVGDDKDEKKKHKEEFYALDHVSIHADEGEILGLLGPNGAGKTTLLRILGTVMSPTSGEVYLMDGGERVTGGRVEMCRHIGYLSENTKLYHRFSVREIMHMTAEIYGMEKAAVEERVNEIISLMGMEAFADNRIEALSTGQTQRANIARCLVHSPQIYIFDEPTLGLDIISSETIIDFMKNERDKGRTVLYSTHYMEEAQYLCDRINMISGGRIIADGSPAELMAQTGTDNLRDTFKALNK